MSMSIRGYLILGSMVFAILLAVVAFWIPDEFVRALVLAGETIPLGALTIFVVQAIDKHLEKSVLLKDTLSWFSAVLAVLLAISTVYYANLAYHRVIPCGSACIKPARPYPVLTNASVADGLIADFAQVDSGANNPAAFYTVNVVRTALGTQCSLFSDSSINQASTIWYEWATLGSPIVGGGIVRIHYQLRPSRGGEPFVGIYCILSYPPGTPFDVSRFNALSYKLRAADPAAASRIGVRAVLYCNCLTTAQLAQYAYPVDEVPSPLLMQQWQQIRSAFRDFHRPGYYQPPDKITVDKRRVFQIGFLIVGLPDPVTGAYADTSGSIDLDDVRFSQ